MKNKKSLPDRLNDSFDKLSTWKKLAVMLAIMLPLEFGVLSLADKIMGGEEFRRQRNLEDQLYDLRHKYRKQFEKRTFTPNSQYDTNQDGQVDLGEKVKAYETLLGK